MLCLTSERRLKCDRCHAKDTLAVARGRERGPFASRRRTLVWCVHGRVHSRPAVRSRRLRRDRRSFAPQTLSRRCCTASSTARSRAQSRIIGVARSDIDTDAFRKMVHESRGKFAPGACVDRSQVRRSFMRHIEYVRLDATAPAERVGAAEGGARATARATSASSIFRRRPACS